MCGEIMGCNVFAEVQKAWGQVSTAETGVKAMSELLGTGLLVLVACMGCLPGWATGAPPPVQYSLSVGLVVMFVVQVYHTSILSIAFLMN